MFILYSELYVFMIIEAVSKGDNEGCTYSIFSFSLHPRKHRFCMHVLSAQHLITLTIYDEIIRNQG